MAKWKLLEEAFVNDQNVLDGFTLLKHRLVLVERLNFLRYFDTSRRVLEEFTLLVEGVLNDGGLFESFGHGRLVEQGWLSHDQRESLQSARIDMQIHEPEGDCSPCEDDFSDTSGLDLSIPLLTIETTSATKSLAPETPVSRPIRWNSNDLPSQDLGHIPSISEASRGTTSPREVLRPTRYSDPGQLVDLHSDLLEAVRVGDQHEADNLPYLDADAKVWNTIETALGIAPETGDKSIMHLLHAPRPPNRARRVSEE